MAKKKPYVNPLRAQFERFATNLEALAKMQRDFAANLQEYAAPKTEVKP